MYDQQKMMQEVFKLSKDYWQTTVDMLSTFQEQSEKMWDVLMSQGLINQQEGKKMFQDWLDRASDAREQYIKTTEDNWKKAETMFTKGTPTDK